MTTALLAFLVATTATFQPLATWQAAVGSGNTTGIQSLYSQNPVPTILHNGHPGSLDDELRALSALSQDGITGLNPKVLSIVSKGDQTTLVLRVAATRYGQTLVAPMLQVWAHEANGWRIVASNRYDFQPDQGRRLPEPAKPNPSLYPEPSAAPAELKSAIAEAHREHKRVLVVFGANWCYDCHVLDATFHSKDFAPLVQSNYVVLHINTGDEGKDNGDLARQLGVNLDHGIPSLAVLDGTGKVLEAQQNGEFESTTRIGPEDVRAFLERWKR